MSLCCTAPKLLASNLNGKLICLRLSLSLSLPFSIARARFMLSMHIPKTYLLTLCNLKFFIGRILHAHTHTQCECMKKHFKQQQQQRWRRKMQNIIKVINQVKRCWWLTASPFLICSSIFSSVGIPFGRIMPFAQIKWRSALWLASFNFVIRLNGENVSFLITYYYCICSWLSSELALQRNKTEATTKNWGKLIESRLPLSLSHNQSFSRCL